MSAFDPLNNAAPQLNAKVPMGWEYVWHCHLLGHEENDMMRESVFQVPPQTPLNLTAVALATGNQIKFTDMSLSETGFTVQRATDSAFTVGVSNLTANANPGWNNTVTYLDTNATKGTSYYYRVQSFKPDADYWSPLIGTAGTPIPLPNLVSGWSNAATLSVSPILQLTPTTLSFGPITPPQTSAPQQITVQNIGVGTLNISSMRIVAGANPNGFAVTANTCTTTLASGASCAVSIVLRSTVGGSQSASFTVVSNAPGNGTQSVALTGVVTVPVTITASSPTMNWGAAIPLITPIAVGMVPPDTLASLGPITCTTTFTAGALPGPYPTSCSGANNPAYSYTYVAGTLTVVPTTATMISPVQGSVLPSPTQTFTWTSWPGATQYVVCLATMLGGNNIGCSAPLHTTTWTASNLPMTGQTIYVQLMTWFPTGRSILYYTYTGLPIKSVMITPVPGSTTTRGAATFTWTAGQGVGQYGLYVGNQLGWGNFLTFYSLTATTASVSNLPTNGSKLYVRLLYRINGVWQYTDYTYVAGP